MDNDHTISKYDRKRSDLQDLALWTKPSTIQNIDKVIGRAETFVVRTARCEDQGGDFILVECVDEATAVTRLILPPKVADAIAAQRASLTARRRSLAAKRTAQARKDRGEQPAFLRK
jgi:hypothetical protein